jgi:L-glyceraldehyde 3-phosphate reductase
MWQRFTERARKVVFYAQEEAQRFGEGYVSTEHLLLGLVRETDSVSSRVLEADGVSLNKIRAEVEKQLPKGDARASQDMTLTPRAKRVIDLAYDEARNLGNNYIGTEHLLLGLVREGDGLAGRVLAKLGIELEKSRGIVMKLQDSDSLERIENPTPGSKSRAPHVWAEDRYEHMQFRRCGRSGLKLPAISLGAWETFGGYRGPEVARECLFAAFDLGITHFDFANNYGTPPGNAELVCGNVLKQLPRDEMIISSKAGYTMWPGPYGDWGSRKSIIASCDQSLQRMGVEYFDIFYSHRFDPETPIEETMGALSTLVRHGKALYAGISNYNGERTRMATDAVSAQSFAPITINQVRANMINRGFISDLIPTAVEKGLGIIAFCPLASGLLTSKYLSGVAPEDSRASEKWGNEWLLKNLTRERLEALTQLNQMAEARGQTLAQMSLAWLLNIPEVTSALIGASSKAQIEENVKALDNLSFTQEELAKIEELLPT